MLKVKTSQVQILLVLSVLIAEDGFGAPLLFKNPACSCENILLNRAIISGGRCRTQEKQLLGGPFIKHIVRKRKKLQVLF